MAIINLNDVGATAALAGGQWQLAFGIYLPGITYNKGYTLGVRIIHEADQFVRGIEPKDFYLNWINGSALDLWQVTVPLTPDATSHFGQAGRYLYRFQLTRGGRDVTFWFADPFGREAGLGTLSAIVVGNPAPFAWTDGGFTVPEIDSLVVYELNVREFNQTFSGVVDQLDYITELGVNTLELMPITNVKEDAEWGYTPLSYFAPDDRLGTGADLKALVNECHQRGVAVILDSVYAHAHPEFAYNLVYDTSGELNPMMGAFAREFFPDRPGTDYTKSFTRDYFFQVNQYWMREYHIDGFRYDYVPGFYDGPVGEGYADLVYKTYNDSKTILRFKTAGGQSKIIQCAEHLPDPKGILSQTYSNCAWQNGLLDKFRDMAHWNYVHESCAHPLDPEFIGYPNSFQNTAAGDSFPVAPFQYFESHDHPRFINEFGTIGERDLIEDSYGDRSRFYKMQPFVIALYTAKGIPMLWNGQEFGENWGLPNSGIGRNLFERPLHWEYFYDTAGKALIRLYRIMGRLRRQLRSLGSRGYFYYYDDPSHLSKGVIAYRREILVAAGINPESLIVALNFFDDDAKVSITFPTPGTWKEQIDGILPAVSVTQSDQQCVVNVPSNYGVVYLRE